MPYKTIVYAKLERRLFNDPRWYMMNEIAQLNYIRFILFAAETYNKIPKNIIAIKRAFKTDQALDILEASISEIKASFPKFKENKHFYYFADFEEKTNYIPDRAKLGKSQGLPQDGVKEQVESIEDKNKNRDRNKKRNDILHLWNSKMPWKIQSITKERQVRLRERLKEQTFDMGIICTRILNSDFLMGRRTGEGHEHFKADFDWVIKNSTNYIKILEGKYDNKPQKKGLERWEVKKR